MSGWISLSWLVLLISMTTLLGRQIMLSPSYKMGLCDEQIPSGQLAFETYAVPSFITSTFVPRLVLISTVLFSERGYSPHSFPSTITLTVSPYVLKISIQRAAVAITKSKAATKIISFLIFLLPSFVTLFSDIGTPLLLNYMFSPRSGKYTAFKHPVGHSAAQA